MPYEERYYQTEAADAGAQYIFDQKGNPVVVLPTGSGKTVVMLGLIDRFLTRHPRSNVVVLSDRKTILEQNHEAIEGQFGFAGLYSSGLGQKEISKITVAGIQSVHRKPKLFSNCGLAIVDECHLINAKRQGMYRNFLHEVGCPVVGLTATHFRLGHGYIHKGKDALFNGIAYDLSEPEKFNRLIEEGYLSNIYSKRTAMKMSVDGVRIVAGDYDQKQLAEKNCRDDITEAAVEETVQFGKNYKKWLIFAINIVHGMHIAYELNKRGISAGFVHSKMKGDFEEEMRKFRRGDYRAMVNVEMLTTGFDDPSIDLIAMMRPTSSPVIHVQSAGRGSRVVYAPGHALDTIEGRLAAIAAGPKSHCLFLDFAGNTRRLGPINDVKVKEKGEKKGLGSAMTKMCPECECDNHLSAKVCAVCGEDFPEVKEKLAPTAFSDELIAKAKRVKADLKEKPVWLDVTDVTYEVASRAGHPDALLVRYQCGLRVIKQYVRPEHGGYPGSLGRHWLRRRFGEYNPPRTVSEAFTRRGEIPTPVGILVQQEGKYINVMDTKVAGEA